LLIFCGETSSPTSRRNYPTQFVCLFTDDAEAFSRKI
jgi:hypothetical protein